MREISAITLTLTANKFAEDRGAELVGWKFRSDGLNGSGRPEMEIHYRTPAGVDGRAIVEITTPASTRAAGIVAAMF